MRLKCELYQKEHDDIVKKIIDILDLDSENSITLYELDTNKDKQDKIVSLIPEIRKYYNFTCIKGVREPENVKRPYLSIIRHVTKPYYNLYNSDARIIVDNKKLRTTKYIFSKKA